MSLNAALNAAISGLRVNQAHVQLVSANVAHANDPNYTKKTLLREAANLGEGQVGGVQIAGFQAAISASLRRQYRVLHLGQRPYQHAAGISQPHPDPDGRQLRHRRAAGSVQQVHRRLAKLPVAAGERRGPAPGDRARRPAGRRSAPPQRRHRPDRCRYPQGSRRLHRRAERQARQGVRAQPAHQSLRSERRGAAGADRPARPDRARARQPGRRALGRARERRDCAVHAGRPVAARRRAGAVRLRRHQPDLRRQRRPGQQPVARRQDQGAAEPAL